MPLHRGNFGAPVLGHTALVAGAGHTVLVAAPVGIVAAGHSLLEAGRDRGCTVPEVAVDCDDTGIEDRGLYWLGRWALALG